MNQKRPVYIKSVPICALLLLSLMAMAAEVLAQPLMTLDNEKAYGFVLFDNLELAPAGEGVPLQWDAVSMIGKQYNRLWITSEGEAGTSQRGGEIEMQALYSRLIAPYWEAQAGIRYDVAYAGNTSQTRGHLVLALEGMAPYWFELEPSLFISQDGDVSASLTGTYDLFVTQRLIVQPRLDLPAAAQEVEKWGVGSGLNSVGFGFRLRYEIKREIAPYAGLKWTRMIGKTADFARSAGEDAGTLWLVAGLRLWR